MKTYTQEELQEILRLHTLWLQGDPEGMRANWSNAHLSGPDLSRSDLFHTCIFSFSLDQHFGYAWKQGKDIIVKINYEAHVLEDWLEKYKEIGKKHSYTNDDIMRCGIQLKAIKKMKL